MLCCRRLPGAGQTTLVPLAMRMADMMGEKVGETVGYRTRMDSKVGPKTYFDVKRDLNDRYPKHYWPDDPLQAEPTNRAKRRKP